MYRLVPHAPQHLNAKPVMPTTISIAHLLLAYLAQLDNTLLVEQLHLAQVLILRFNIVLAL